MDPAKWKDTRLYADWSEAVKVEPQNDFVAVVTPSSRTPVSGTGKSTLLATLGKRTDLSSGGFDAEAKASLDAREIAYEIVPKIESSSAVVWDEAQGMVGTEGLDARRSMRQSSIDAINSILGNRDKNLTILIGAQQLKMLDSRLYPIIDAWLLIRYAPGQPEGPFGTYYKVHTNDFNLKNLDWETPGQEDFTWDPLPDDDPDYQHLEAIKQEAKSQDSSGGNGNTPSPQQERNQRIKKLYGQGVSQTKLAEGFDLDQSQISRIVNSES